MLVGAGLLTDGMAVAPCRANKACVREQQRHHSGASRHSGARQGCEAHAVRTTNDIVTVSSATSLSASIWVVREYGAFDAKLFGFLLGKFPITNSFR